MDVVGLLYICDYQVVITRLRSWSDRGRCFSWEFSQALDCLYIVELFGS